MAGSDASQPLSKQLTPLELPGARKRVPPRALGFSAAAMLVAIYGAFTHPDILAGYDALSWLLLLVPAFVLAYYRGWQGATRALAGGTLAILLVELAAEQVWGVEVEWTFLLLIALVLVFAGVGMGVVSEFLQKERVDALVLAYSDPLTGLPNRRLLDFMLSKEFAAAQRGRPLSIVLFDVDDFKAYNDRYGHKLGDEALQSIGEILDTNTRYMNVSGRYGGEEFLSILSGEKAEGAWVFTERTREAISEAVMSSGARLSVSAGIACYDPSLLNTQQLLERADAALRRAKVKGRDRTVVAPMPTGAIAMPENFAKLPEPARLAFEDAQRQRAMEEAERKYRNLFNGVPVGLYRSLPSGQILDANPHLVQMLGYPDRASLLADDANDLFVDRRARRRWRELMERDGVVRNFEMRLRRRDGKTIWVRDSARGVLDDQGKIMYYEGTLEDVTERKRAENALREAHEALRAAIQASPLAMMGLDREGRVQSWNAAAERIFGWKADEAVGKRPPFVTDEQEEEFNALLSRVLGGESLIEVEVRRQRKDRANVDLALWAAPLRDATGAVNGVMGVMADVTERRRLEMQLRQAQKMESLGRLAGGVAHDFNNLLTVILGNCELALGEMNTADPARGGVEEIREAAKRASALTRQLLAFSRRQKVDPQVVDLNDVIADLERMLRRVLGETVRLTTELAPDLGKVMVDRGQMEQVLMNLAVNARDAMSAGGELRIETLNVDLGRDEVTKHRIVEEPGPYILLSVIDNGCGMDEETRSRIFEPFFTTKEKGKGTGLGLSTVYGIVKESSGYLWVHSRPQVGTRFDIFLPRLDGKMEAAEKRDSSAEGALRA